MPVVLSRSNRRRLAKVISGGLLGVLSAARPTAGSRVGAGINTSPRQAIANVIPEGRALWVNRFEYGSAEEIARIMARAGEVNLNIVYFQVRGAADALYRSEIEPCAVGLCGQLGGTPPYDPLEVAVEEAGKNGIEVHAWLNALSGWPSGGADVCELLTEPGDDSPRHILLEHPDWVVAHREQGPQTCPNDDEYLYLSPVHEQVRAQLAAVAADISRRYGVRGIHLDRIRYPGRAWGYEAAALEAFGRDPESDATAWDEFRRDLINRTVRETYDSMTAVDPSLTLSAALWPVYTDEWDWNASEGYRWFYQDSHAWARDGYLDVAVPMTYDPITAIHCDRVDWSCLLDDHYAGIQEATGRHVYISVAARNGADEILREIDLGRERGVAGFAIYSYGSVDDAGLWSKLANGPFKDRAAVPPQPWKQPNLSPGDGTGGPQATPAATPETPT